MAITTAGVIPNCGDIEVGGEAIKLHFRRVGGMVVAKRDTFSRVYQVGEDGLETGKYTMTGAVRKVKGQEYFEDWEVTGSTKEVKGVKKFSLLHYWQDELFPVLDDAARQRNVIVKFQWDGAGPHTDKTLNKFLQEEFDKRGWIFKLQPSQSPILNIMDACVFPSLSKKVSTNQALSFEGIRRVLKGDEIFEAAARAWREMPLNTIGAAFAGHAQIAAAVYEAGGDCKQFMRGSNNTHFGIRKTYVLLRRGWRLRKLLRRGVI